MIVLDKKKFAEQPKYSTKIEKIKAREEIVKIYREITGNFSIPVDRNYWTLCNWQPDSPGSEINQLVDLGLLTKSQFHGIDYDYKQEGIIEYNMKAHPEAHWYKGDWLEMIDKYYDHFNPALVFLDLNKTVKVIETFLYLSNTLNVCPPNTVVAANLMLEDGHSTKKFDPNILIKKIHKYLNPNHTWQCLKKYYEYKCSKVNMATFIFTNEKV